MRLVATGMAMVMAIIATPILTATVMMDTRIDHSIVTGMIIIGVGDKKRGWPLPTGYNSSPLAKSSI